MPWAGSKSDEIQKEVRPGVDKLKLVIRAVDLSVWPRYGLQSVPAGGNMRWTELEWNHGHASLREEMCDRFL